MRKEGELHPDTEGAEVLVELTRFPTRDDWRSQRRKHKKMALNQRRVLLLSLEEGQKVLDAAKSGGDSSQLTQLFFFFFFFVQGGDGSSIERDRERVSGDGVISRREETSQTSAKSLGLHQT